jgi:hypothetical protein
MERGQTEPIGFLGFPLFIGANLVIGRTALRTPWLTLMGKFLPWS